MKKLLIIGHPQSGYPCVERLLHACGMAPALPSRREGFSPTQISATLAKVYDVPALKHLGEGSTGVRQISPGPVWQCMALDLMLGNIDQPLWGWADPQAIHWLNYWCSADPDLYFILVYDGPHSLLRPTDAQDAADLTPEALALRIRHWALYNAALLHFFHRNPQRCLLVHSEQVQASAASYLNQVRARIDAPWSDRAEALASPGGQNAATAEPSSALVSAPAQPIQDARAAELDAGESAVARFVADTLLRDQPQSRQVYEELQAAANLPLVADDEPGRDTSLALDAWAALLAQRDRLQKQHRLVQRLDAARVTAEQLAQESLALLHDQQRLRASEAQAHQDAMAELALAREREDQTRAGMRQENDLLLGQLHKMQEELERQDLASRESLQQQQQLAVQRQKEIERLNKSLSATQQQVNDAAQKLQDLEKARQLAAQRQQEIERLNEALSTARKQVGDTMQKLQELEKAHALASQRQQPAQPPAAVASADPALAEENEMLLSQLHAAQEELERYYLENQQLKAQPAEPQPDKAQPAAPYGAGDRVRQQLDYRIGVALIENSRSLRGWIAMPWALRDVLRQYRREEPQRAAQDLPPLHTYRDAHDAERVRNHLSCRLGEVFLANARGPLGWLRMPFSLLREVQVFRQRQSRPQTAHA